MESLGVYSHFCDTRESPPLYGVLVFGKPFLLYHRSGHFPQPCVWFLCLAFYGKSARWLFPLTKSSKQARPALWDATLWSGSRLCWSLGHRLRLRCSNFGRRGSLGRSSVAHLHLLCFLFGRMVALQNGCMDPRVPRLMFLIRCVTSFQHHWLGV